MYGAGRSGWWRRRAWRKGRRWRRAACLRQPHCAGRRCKTTPTTGPCCRPAWTASCPPPRLQGGRRTAAMGVRGSRPPHWVASASQGRRPPRRQTRRWVPQPPRAAPFHMSTAGRGSRGPGHPVVIVLPHNLTAFGDAKQTGNQKAMLHPFAGSAGSSSRDGGCFARARSGCAAARPGAGPGGGRGAAIAAAARRTTRHSLYTTPGGGSSGCLRSLGNAFQLRSGPQVALPAPAPAPAPAGLLVGAHSIITGVSECLCQRVAYSLDLAQLRP